MAKLIEYRGRIIEVKLLATENVGCQVTAYLLRGEELTRAEWRQFRRGIRRQVKRLGVQDMNWEEQA